MTNKELQNLLKQYPDDLPIYVPWDREGDNFQCVDGIISKGHLKNDKEYLTLCDIEEEEALLIC